MNIAAWRAACDVWDLDRTAKHALQVICGHLGRPPATDVEVRIARLAVEMGVHYDTAYRALRRLRRTGYVSTAYRAGHTLLVTLNTDRLNLTPRGITGTPPAPARGLVEELDTNRTASTVPALTGRRRPPTETGPSQLRPLRPIPTTAPAPAPAGSNTPPASSAAPHPPDNDHEQQHGRADERQHHQDQERKEYARSVLRRRRHNDLLRRCAPLAS